MLSGVGPAAPLQKFGIPVVLDKPGVGANLHDHLQLRMIYKVSGIKTLNETYAKLAGRLAMGADYLLRRRGPMTMAPSQLGAFTRSDETQDRANIQYHVQPLSLDKFGEPLHPFPAFTASVANIRPTSRGALSLKSADPRAAAGDRAKLSGDAGRPPRRRRFDPRHAQNRLSAGAAEILAGRISAGRRSARRR